MEIAKAFFAINLTEKCGLCKKISKCDYVRDSDQSGEIYVRFIYSTDNSLTCIEQITYFKLLYRLRNLPCKNVQAY
jgi:hypothetical protein